MREEKERYTLRVIIKRSESASLLVSERGVYHTVAMRRLHTRSREITCQSFGLDRKSNSFFNEIVPCTMKSEQARMKSSAYGFRWNQIRRSYPCEAGFHRAAISSHESGISSAIGGFSWKKTVTFATVFFLGLPDRILNLCFALTMWKGWLLL